MRDPHKAELFSTIKRRSLAYSLSLSATNHLGGGRVLRRCWENFQYLGVLLIWIIVGLGLTELAVGAGGVVWTFFSRLSFLFSFSFSGRRPDID